MTNPITDYRLIQEKDGTVLQAYVVFNNFHKVFVTKPELEKMLWTLETIYYDLDPKEDLTTHS